MKREWYLLSVAFLVLLVVYGVYGYDAERDNLPWKTERAHIAGVTKVKFEKITSLEDIPELVLQSINGLNESKLLERGAWSFAYEMFQTEVSYFMFCGGDKFSNGYDVDILRQWQGPSNYTYGQPPSILHISMTYCFKIKESEIDKNYEYCQGFTYPFVIFKAEKVLATQEGVYRVLTNDGEIMRGRRANPWY